MARMAQTAMQFQVLVDLPERLAFRYLAKTGRRAPTPIPCRDRPAQLRLCQDRQAQPAHRSLVKTAETATTEIQCQVRPAQPQQFQVPLERLVCRSQAMTGEMVPTAILFRDCLEWQDWPERSFLATTAHPA